MFNLICFVVHVFLKMRKATLAFWILASTSCSVPGWFYCPGTWRSWLLPLVSSQIDYVVVLRIGLNLCLASVDAECWYCIEALFCTWLWLCERRARSSAKSKSSNWLQRVSYFLVFSSLSSLWPAGRGKVTEGTPSSLLSSPWKSIWVVSMCLK